MPNARATLRPGRTLPELLVTLTVSGILFALLTGVGIALERLVAGSTAIAESRSHVRQAHQIAPLLLRAVAGADLYMVQDSLAEFAYPIASAVVCLPSQPHQVMLAPDTVANGQHYASLTHMPRPGDLAHIFDPGVLPTATDDRWLTASVSWLGVVPNGCAGSALLDSVADAAHRARVVSVAATTALIPAGAVVAFTRRTRAAVYASSGNDYLGISDFDPTTLRWSVVQPVSGPYFSRPGAPGVHFQLLDSLGALLPVGALPINASTFALRVRSQTATQVRITGMRRGARAESLSSHIALRNR
jgi:hypothetical protein